MSETVIDMSTTEVNDEDSNLQAEHEEIGGPSDVPEGDLFGDEDNEDADATANTPALDDRDLDSDDGTGREDPLQEEREDEEQSPNREPAQIATHALPRGSDGELYLLKVPNFFAFEPTNFEPTAFQAPSTDMHSKAPPSADFSAHKTAMKAVRWRWAPDNPARLQSNGRILRWSDGSLTLQLATDPSTQYPIDAKSLAPPQLRPRKPTPMSAAPNTVKMRKLHPNNTSVYNAELDSFTYLGAASASASVVRTTNKLTTSLTVKPTKEASDDAVALLQTRMAASRETKQGTGDAMLGGMAITSSIEDPELAQRQAEKAEKESQKAQRKRENQESREKERANRALGRRGLAGGQLTIGALEDDDELGTGTRRGQTGSRKKQKTRRINHTGEIYSDDEEPGLRGRTKEDEYDEEDDFVAGSDEEDEIVDDDNEEEEDIDEKIEKSERARGKKRDTPENEHEEAEQDAEGEPDDAVADGPTASRGEEGSPQARSKRRRVIDDDDEE